VFRADREGREPDARFSLANERTFLAYLRTSLALFAAGAAVLRLEIIGRRSWDLVIGIGLVGLGVLTSGTSYQRWRRVERAMRQSVPLPRTTVPLVLAVGLTILGMLFTVLAVLL
jgi:putative membrane protein